jgi:hypothetical protein
MFFDPVFFDGRYFDTAEVGPASQPTLHRSIALASSRRAQQLEARARVLKPSAGSRQLMPTSTSRSFQIQGD